MEKIVRVNVLIETIIEQTLHIKRDVICICDCKKIVNQNGISHFLFIIVRVLLSFFLCLFLIIAFECAHVHKSIKISYTFIGSTVMLQNDRKVENELSAIRLDTVQT